MSQDNRNIYQIARESAGFTQEKASELLDISVESVRAYEGNRRVPPDHIVIRMIEIYDTQYLAYQHLRANAELARSMIPQIALKDLPTAVLNLYKEISDFSKIRDDLLDITCDGVIDEDERPRFEQILKELDDIVNAVYTLKFAK